jgi:hypothetical protein
MLMLKLRKKSILDDSIHRVLVDMQNNDPGSSDYEILMSRLERLVQMKAEERRDRISPDTVAIVAGNLLGIFVIVSYERAHVMVSKGLGFVLKTRHSP